MDPMREEAELAERGRLIDPFACIDEEVGKISDSQEEILRDSDFIGGPKDAQRILDQLHVVNLTTGDIEIIEHRLALEKERLLRIDQAQYEKRGQHTPQVLAIGHKRPHPGHEPPPEQPRELIKEAPARRPRAVQPPFQEAPARRPRAVQPPFQEAPLRPEPAPPGANEVVPLLDAPQPRSDKALARPEACDPVTRYATQPLAAPVRRKLPSSILTRMDEEGGTDTGTRFFPPTTTHIAQRGKGDAPGSSSSAQGPTRAGTANKEKSVAPGAPCGQAAALSTAAPQTGKGVAAQISSAARGPILPPAAAGSASAPLGASGDSGSGVTFPANLMDVINAISRNPNRRLENFDILDIAAMKGIEFPKPKWWRKEGYELKWENQK